jgi:hypothetical protein
MRKILALLILLAIPAVAQFGGPMGGMRPGSMQGGGLLPGRGGDPLWVAAGPTKPKLDLDFAKRKDLTDAVSGKTSLVTFSRSAAQSPGTYVGADGLIHDAAVNLAFYSEQFDNAAWSKEAGVTVTANQAIAPDGKQTADKVSSTAEKGLWQTKVLGAGTYTFSVYLKATASTTGLIGRIYPGDMQSIAITTEWQRFDFTFTLSGSTTNYPQIRQSSDFGVADIFIWGAQLEETDAATMAPTAYIKTTSQALAAPRFDHEPTTGNLTTNLLTYSEMLDQWSAWANASVTTNVAEAPDGTTTADRITFDGTTNGRVERATSATGTVTQSVYLRTESGTQEVKIGPSSGSLTTYTVDTTWQRYTHTGTGSYPRILSNDAGSVLAWGAQLETGSTAGTYVRTLSETRSISDAVAPSLGLLVEEARVNHWPYSESSTGITFATGSSAGTNNSAVAPDGTMTADEINVNGGNAYRIYNTFDNKDLTFSVYAKGVAGETVRLQFYDYGTAGFKGAQTFTLSEDWQRLSVTANIIGNPTPGASDVIVYVADNRTGAGTATSMHIWGMQLEEGAFETSQIPTAGTSQTRYADTAAVQDEDFATTNLISYSESFDVGWSTSRITVYENLVDGPFPGGQADGVVPFIGPGAAYLSATPTGTGQTFSVYVKPNGVDWLFLSGPISSDNVWFDLQNVAVGTKQPNVKGASIQSIGNGWLLLQMTSTSSGSSGVGISLADADNTSTVTGDGISGLYLWGASFTATEYPVEYTTTRNLLTDSQDFERSTWVKSAATIDNDVAQAPDGTITADRITDDATFGVHNLKSVPSVTPTGKTVTFSAYVKAQTAQAVRLNLQTTGANYSQASFDLQNEVTVSSTGGDHSASSSSILSVGNGWFRISLTSTLGADTSWGSYGAQIRTEDPYLNHVYSGTGKTLLIWAAQLEPGTTATDYVRTVDVVGKAYQWFEPTEGTVFVDFRGGRESTYGGYGRIIKASKGGTTTWRLEATPLSSSRMILQTSGSNVINGQERLTDFGKYAFSYRDGIKAIASSPALVTSFSFPNFSTDTSDKWEFGKDGSIYMNGHIRRLTYWPVRQSDSTLQVITQ